MQGIRVNIAIHSDSFNTQLFCCAYNTTCNFSSVLRLEYTWSGCVLSTYLFAINILSKWGLFLVGGISDNSKCNYVSKIRQGIHYDEI
jgi:hypothetical protein